MGNDNKNHRPCDQRYEKNNHTLDRPTSPIRSRYDTITREAEYSSKNKRNTWQKKADQPRWH